MFKLIKPTFAQDAIGSLKDQLPANIKAEPEDFGNVLSTAIRVIIAIAGVWFLVQLLLAGLTYISGSGDAKKTQEAMRKITDSIVGIVIVAASFIVVSLVSNLFFGSGFDILNPEIQTLE